MKEFLKCYQCADASDDRWALLLVGISVCSSGVRLPCRW